MFREPCNYQAGIEPSHATTVEPTKPTTTVAEFADAPPPAKPTTPLSQGSALHRSVCKFLSFF